MANTFELIASSAVGSGGASSITFSSIPSTFTDLCIKFSARDNSSYIANNIDLSFNGSTASFSVRNLYGNGTSATSGTQSNAAGLAAAANATANTFGNSEFYIPNYAGSTNKSYSGDSVSENNATEAYDWFYAGLRSNTAAITSITITAGSSATFQNHSNFYLYGVKNA